MKKQLIFTLYIVLLFVAVNVSFLWQENSGSFGFYWSAFLLASFFLFSFVQLLIVGYVLVKKRFEWKRIGLNLLTLVLLATLYFFPKGILKPIEKRTLFIEAFSEKASNCTTSLKLFQNNEFKEISICFEITAAEGTYEIKNDTLYFSTQIFPRGAEKYYDYAILRTLENRSEIVRFYQKDSTEYPLSIVAKK